MPMLLEVYMRIVIVDSASEGQALCAMKVKELSGGEIDKLDMELKLTNTKEFKQHLENADAAILGPGLKAEALALARQIYSISPDMSILLFVAETLYSEEVFRNSHSLGIQKILPASASSLDILQELLAIHTKLCRQGKTSVGQLILISTVNGGAGSTSITAALGEVLVKFGNRVLVWDTDYETKDLCRALRYFGSNNVIGSWVDCSANLSRESFKDALISMEGSAFLLPPPQTMAQSMDLYCHTDGSALVSKIADYARYSFNYTIIDGGGTSGPAKGALLHNADKVLIVLNQCQFGYSSLLEYLENLKRLVSNLKNLYFLINGAQISGLELQEILNSHANLPPSSFSLPTIPKDEEAGRWHGTGNTLYSAGSKNTSAAIQNIAHHLGCGIPEDSELGTARSVTLSRLLRGMWSHSQAA
jgi:cellulose biosynthesis protein BcsQ/cellobiose-specific phosphotransferase system component IIB